jgi:hypothetical protein
MKKPITISKNIGTHLAAELFNKELSSIRDDFKQTTTDLQNQINLLKSDKALPRADLQNQIDLLKRENAALKQDSTELRQALADKMTVTATHSSAAGQSWAAIINKKGKPTKTESPIRNVNVAPPPKLFFLKRQDKSKMINP